jgi:hypothetical protein
MSGFAQGVYEIGRLGCSFYLAPGTQKLPDDHSFNGVHDFAANTQQINSWC